MVFDPDKLERDENDCITLGDIPWPDYLESEDENLRLYYEFDYELKTSAGKDKPWCFNFILLRWSTGHWEPQAKCDMIWHGTTPHQDSFEIRHSWFVGDSSCGTGYMNYLHPFDLIWGCERIIEILHGMWGNSMFGDEADIMGVKYDNRDSTKTPDKSYPN